MASSSREAAQLEQQNDQRLDELHSKIRSLKGVTSDIYEDVESQRLTLDDMGDRFSSFGSSLAASSQRAARALGLRGGVKQWRIIIYCVGGLVGFWIVWKILGWWWGSS